MSAYISPAAVLSL